MTEEYIRQLAKDLEEAYDNALPSAIEDAISICILVEHLTGEELTLEDAEALRNELETNQYNRRRLI